MKNKSRTWILLRGLGREKGHWGAFLDRFGEAFRGDEVLAIDLPGAGEFRDQVSPRTMNEMFEFVRGQAIERARTQSQFRLVALSLGGMLALEWMRQRPEDLDGCVLINTSVKELSPLTQRLRWQAWPRLITMVTQQSLRDREKALVQILINSEEAREKALPLWTKLSMDHPISSKTLLNQLLAASRFMSPRLAGETPVLVLSGLGDRLVDPSCSAALAEKFGWPLERHSWGGHDLTWDDPEWVLEKIKTWSGTVDDKH